MVDQWQVEKYGSLSEIGRGLGLQQQKQQYSYASTLRSG